MKTFTKYGIEVNPLGAQLWSLLSYGLTAKAIFAGWGCSNIQSMTTENGYEKYMVIFNGLWHYAHSNGSSCYLSTHEGYKTSRADTAWRMHKHDGALGSLANARETVAELEGKLEALADLIQGD